MSNPPDNSLPRRDFLKTAVAAGALHTAIGAAVDSKAQAAGGSSTEAKTNRIIEENKKEGAVDWQLTRVRVDSAGFRSPWIEGFCSRQSYEPGDEVEIYVSTKPVRKFDLEIFRMGYYDGRGARLVKTINGIQGKEQATPEPGEKLIHECKWDSTVKFKIPEGWVSGVYLGRMTTIPEGVESYWQSYIVFVVRENRPSEILFQCSDNTWQAYNVWPNKYSLYTHPKGVQGPWADVSFDRPYGREAQHQGVVNDPLTVGSGEFLPFEFPLAFWLEQQGYDVTYCCNCDMITPELGLKAKAFISVGHDEYWDIRQYDSVTKMRDEGVNLLFLSGNSVCWVTPFRAGSNGVENRIIFRGGPYGGDREHAQERAKLFGPYPHHGPDEGLLMGACNVRPVNGGGDWIVSKPEHWIFEGTGVKAGDKIPGLIGWEYHGDPSDLPGLEVVATGTAWNGGVNPREWTATIYDGPKGNYVFNAATIFWAQGMSHPPGHVLPWSHWSRPHGPDPRVQRITKNLLDRAVR